MITGDTVKGAFPVKPLGAVAEFLDSRRRPVKESDRKPGAYPYYGANGQQGTIDGYLFDEPLVLLAEDGGYFNAPERGIAYRISGKTWVNNHAHIIKPRDGIDLAFLCRVLENYDVSPFISGSTRAKLTKSQAEKIEIPVPPLAEQKRIAEILDRADNLRRLRQRAIERLNSLGQAIFLEMFGDPRSNPKNYPLRRLGDVADVRDGTHDSPAYVDEGHPLLTSKNFTSGKLNFEGAKLISDDDYKNINRRSKVDIGDIVMPMIGTIGSPVVIEEEPNFAIKNVALIKFGASDLRAWYVNTILSGPYLEHHVAAKGRGGTQQFISLGDLRSLEIPVPQRDEQTIFGERLASLKASNREYNLASAKLERLFSSLQHRAFRGEL